MPQNGRNIPINKYINKQKWWDILSKIIDVLRINVFIVDAGGLIILPVEESRFGGKFLTDLSLRFDLTQEAVDTKNDFEPYDGYLERFCRYGLNCFALPVSAEKKEDVIAYMIVGPVILNKKMRKEDYERLALDFGADPSDVLSEINGIRTVSNIMMKSILDLLYEIVENIVKLNIEEQKIRQNAANLKPALCEVEKEIYALVHLDELLVSFLDVALKITETECGSIMVFDERGKDMTIRVSRGLEEPKIQNLRVKRGEGIAGIAAAENISFVMGPGVAPDNRIGHLMRRPDIKESIVMPLVAKNKVFGVINLHTKKSDVHVTENADKLKYLSELFSSAI